MQASLGLETPIHYCERWEAAVDRLLRLLSDEKAERAAHLLARCRVVEEASDRITVRPDNELDAAVLSRGATKALERFAGCEIAVPS